MSEENKPETGAIPPRVSIKVPGQSGEGAVAAEASGKKKTARLSLDQVTAEPGAVPAAPVEGMGVVSKTIRLAPAVVGGQVSFGTMPSLGKALTGNFGHDDVKRQTARIPLESVLPPVSSSTTGAVPGISGVASTIPKTIKVKRPSITLSPSVSPVKIEAVPPATSVSAVPIPEAGAKNQTARVEVTPEPVAAAPAEGQQTQRKTVKIRRADGSEAKPSSEGRSVTIARVDGGAVAAIAPTGQVVKPHGVFVGIAAAALLVLGFMIYVLAAQAYPNLGWSI